MPFRRARWLRVCSSFQRLWGTGHGARRVQRRFGIVPVLLAALRFRPHTSRHAYIYIYRYRYIHIFIYIYTQFFWLLFDSDLTPAGMDLLTIDGITPMKCRVNPILGRIVEFQRGAFLVYRPIYLCIHTRTCTHTIYICINIFGLGFHPIGVNPSRDRIQIDRLTSHSSLLPPGKILLDGRYACSDFIVDHLSTSG